MSVDPNSLVIDPTLIPLYSKPVLTGDSELHLLCATRATIRLIRTKGAITSWTWVWRPARWVRRRTSGRCCCRIPRTTPLRSDGCLRETRRLESCIPMAPTTSSVCHPREQLPTEATSVPLPELFFAGGSNSLRGFSINQAGPRDLQTGYPIGGQGLFVNNLEIRTPPVALPFVGDNLGFVFFHDMGNVFDTANHIISGMLRIHQPSIANCSSADQQGRRAISAITRRRSVWAYAIRHRSGRYASTLATTLIRRDIPIQEKDTVQTLRHINFFFSIGQTF